MWGQVAVRDDDVVHGGIIPTRVGTRGVKNLLYSLPKDHPHACGDKRLFLRADTLSLGSSPRVWGQGVSRICCIRCQRIIPTRVGTSPVKTLPSRRLWDHPHACGDKETSLITYSIDNRIIPTRVGTSCGFNSGGFYS